MVAAELEAQNEDDLFGIVNDVRGFLGRKEGLPAYISRQHIFEEFSKILATKGVEPEKRADVLNLSALLVTDLLQGQKKAKKAEVQGALVRRYQPGLLVRAESSLPICRGFKSRHILDRYKQS
jgi:hypothetical protein